jgi:Ca-activated chloride channel family protein
MTFRDPAMLAGLVLLPLAALAYLSMQRRRRREAAAFANPDLMPNLVTARPGWRRHLPPLLVLLALGALVIALARPQRTVAAPQRAATVMMVTDTSGSMNAEDVDPDRLTAAVSAAKKLTDQLPDNFRLGLVTFADFADVQAPPTTDRDPVKAGLDRLQANGGTAMATGLQRALELARTPVPNENGTGTRRLPAVLVLLSDGKDTTSGMSPIDVARQAKELNIPIFTIALGTPNGEVAVRDQFGFVQRIPVPPDTETLRDIARITGGRYFAAPDAARLESIYSNLGTRLSSKPVEHEVTFAFAGGAVVLLLAGGALSLAWFGRAL